MQSPDAWLMLAAALLVLLLAGWMTIAQLRQASPGTVTLTE
jgi:ABC-type nickel/cobalt efflux system permease component RcnA